MKDVILLAILSLIALLLCSCSTTKVVPVEVERVRVEYQDRLRYERDSVYLHDSIYIVQRGDTVFRDRWKTKIKEVVRIDTAYIEKRDSISYPVVVQVEKPPSFLARMELNLYRIVIMLLLVYVGWFSIRKFLYRRQ